MNIPITADAATGKPKSMSNLKNKSMLLFMPKKKGASNAPRIFDNIINTTF